MPNPIISFEFVPEKGSVVDIKKLSEFAKSKYLDVQIDTKGFSMVKDDKNALNDMCKMILEALKANKPLSFSIRQDYMDGFQQEVAYFLQKQRLDPTLIKQMQDTFKKSQFKSMQIEPEITPPRKENPPAPQPLTPPTIKAQQPTIAAPPVHTGPNPAIKESLYVELTINNEKIPLEKVPDMADKNVLYRVMGNLGRQLWNSNVTAISASIPKDAQEGFKAEIKNQIINFMAHNDKVRGKTVDEKKIKRIMEMVENIKFTEPTVKQEVSQKVSAAPTMGRRAQ